MSPAAGPAWIRLEQEGRVIVERVRVARGLRLRGVGLMFRSAVPEAWGEGLLFRRCRTLHTFGMRFPLDVLFLDGEGRPTKVCRGVRPWRTVSGPRGTRDCLEVAAGRLPELSDAPVRAAPFA